MATTDRISGLNLGVAMKPACYVVSTGNITLSGTQTIDGISVGGNSERVLVSSQTNQVDNGIYIADSSSWIRASDCDGNKDLIPGTVVYVDRGTAFAHSFWAFNSSSTATSVTIETDNITVSSIAVALTGVSSWVSNNWFPVTSASSARSVISAVSSTQAATVDQSNTFTMAQTFSTAVTIGGNISVTSTDGSSDYGPSLTLYRNSSSPAANDQIAQVNFEANTTGIIRSTLATIRTDIVDPSSGSEDGRVTFSTKIAGSLGDRFYLGGGIYGSSAVGGDKGLGTINASFLYKDGQLVGRRWQYGSLYTPTTTTFAAAIISGISTAQEVEIMLMQMKRSAASSIIFRLESTTDTPSTGPGSGYICTQGGYSGGPTANSALSPYGFGLGGFGLFALGESITGVMKLSRLLDSTHTWLCHGVFGTTGINMGNSAGSYTMSGELDTISMVTSATTIFFTAGSVLVRYR